MSLYLLRHCEREVSPQFYASLTTYGKGEAERLIEKIEGLEVDEIYASPFLRTVQTIEPYCRKTGISVKIENALYECIRDTYFDKDNYKYDINDLIKHIPKFNNIIDWDYTSMVNVNEIDCSDDLSLMYNRMVPFIQYIRSRIGEGKNCILVTHRTTFNLIEGYIQSGTFIDEDPPWKPKEGEIKKVI